MASSFLRVTKSLVTGCLLKDKEISLTDDALKLIIESFTREAGVRG